MGSPPCLEFSPGSGKLDLRQTQQGVFSSELRTQGCPRAVASLHRLPEGLRHKYLSTPACTRCLSQVHCSRRGKDITPFYRWKNWAGLRGVGNSTPYTHTLAHTHIYIYTLTLTLSHTHIPPPHLCPCPPCYPSRQPLAPREEGGGRRVLPCQRKKQHGLAGSRNTALLQNSPATFVKCPMSFQALVPCTPRALVPGGRLRPCHARRPPGIFQGAAPSVWPSSAPSQAIVCFLPLFTLKTASPTPVIEGTVAWSQVGAGTGKHAATWLGGQAAIPAALLF